MIATWYLDVCNECKQRTSPSPGGSLLRETGYRACYDVILTAAGLCSKSIAMLARTRSGAVIEVIVKCPFA